MEYSFTITNSTTEDEVDLILANIFKHKKLVILNINLKEYSLNLFKLMKFKRVLDKYRSFSKLYLEYTNLLVNDSILTDILRLLLLVFQPEKPVYLSY